MGFVTRAKTIKFLSDTSMKFYYIKLKSLSQYYTTIPYENLKQKKFKIEDPFYKFFL